MALTTQRSHPLTRLRQVLALDAVVTAVNGLVYLAVSAPVARLLGVPSSLLIIAGGFLIGYGSAVGYLASRSEPAPNAVRAVVVMNSGWVIASVTALLASWIEPSTAGLVWIPLQAAVVAGLAAAQVVFLRRCGRT
jgi:hypothetical protein